MAEMKAGYKDTDIGVIPEDWDVLFLENIANIRGGKRLPKGKALTDFVNSHPYIRVLDMKNGAVDISNIRYVPDDVFPEIKSYRVYASDLFISVAGTLGIIGRVPDVLDGANLTENANRICDLKVNRDFLFYYLNSENIQNHIQSIQTVGAQPKLALSKIEKFIIATPPRIKEQKAIAAALSDVDGLIESLEKLMAKKRDMKTAAMQQLLTGKKRLPGFEGEWRIKKLNDFAEIKKGQLITKKAAVHGDIPVIAGGLKPSYFHNRPNRKPNVITISASGASAGFVAFHSYAIFASDCSTIEQSDAYNTKFIFFALKLRQSEIYELQTGGAQPHVYPEQIKSLYLLFPAIEEQTAIAAILSDMDAEINALEQRLAKARSLKTGMMQELLTGKTRLIKTDKKQEAG